jgi:hypothetical protein
VLLEQDPEAVAEYGMKAIREGRDVRALTPTHQRLTRPRENAHLERGGGAIFCWQGRRIHPAVASMQRFL